jgi:hypothetical protein
MAAPGGIQDNILRVSLAFEKGKNSGKKSRSIFRKKHPIVENAKDPWGVVIEVHSWAITSIKANLRKGA